MRKVANVSQPSDRSKADSSAKPSLVAAFGDWNVFVGQSGNRRICYAIAQPRSREPPSLRRDPGYAFVSDRPAEDVRNELSFVVGFDVSAGTDSTLVPVALVGEASFDLLPKGGNLWIKNAYKESSLMSEMKKGLALKIQVASLEGKQSTDYYSLIGFTQAIDRLQKECP